MTPDAPSSAALENEGARPTQEAMHALADAITRINGDGDFIALALAEFLASQRPNQNEPALTGAEMNFLIASGEFTAGEFDETASRVARGDLQVRAATALLANLHESMSAADTRGFLGINDDELQQRVRSAQIFAVEVAGRQRFPSWQFSLGSPGKILPHLREIIALLKDMSWISVAGFMSTPQSTMVTHGRQTPIEWFRNGGDVAALEASLEAQKWR